MGRASPPDPECGMRVEPRRGSIATPLASWGLLGALLGFAPATPCGAQITTIPTRSQIVHVDVIVTTGRGGLVRDLTQQDFVLLEDESEVPITVFQPPSAVRARRGASTQTNQPDQQEAPATGRQGDYDTFVVYVDNPNLTFAGRRRLLTGLDPFLNAQLQGGRARALVLSEDRGLRALTQLTTDGAEVSRALVDAQRAFPGGQLLVQAERTTLDAVMNTLRTLPCETGSDCLCLLPLLQNIVRTHAGEREQLLRATLVRLAELAAVLGTLPGPKTLFYLSDGLDQRPAVHLFHQLGDICPEAYEKDFQALLAPMQEYDLSRALQELAARANTARLTIYPLDGAGLKAHTLADVSRPGRRLTPSPKTDAMQKANREAGQWILGRETGGYPILNTNNPARALAGVGEELSARYVLGFTPERDPDGRLHRVRVELRRKGFRVRHRPTYYHGERAEEVVGRTLAALVVGIEEDALGASVTASVETSSAEGARLQGSLRIGVPLERLAATTGADESRGRVRIVIAVRRGEPGTGGVSDVREKWIDVPLPESRRGASQPTMRHEIVIAVPDVVVGVEVAVGVQDALSGFATYKRARFEAVVPP